MRRLLVEAENSGLEDYKHHPSTADRGARLTEETAVFKARCKRAEIEAVTEKNSTSCGADHTGERPDLKVYVRVCSVHLFHLIPIWVEKAMRPGKKSFRLLRTTGYSAAIHVCGDRTNCALASRQPCI